MSFKNCDGNIKIVQELLGGNWKYEYSFSLDTCFIIEDFTTLDFPINLSFKDCIDSLDLLNENRDLFKRRKKDLFLNMKCVVRYDENEYETYPIAVYNDELSNPERIKVYHRSLRKERVPIKFSYFIKNICTDELVLEDEKVYQLGEKRISSIQHLFTRNDKETRRSHQ